MSISVLILTLNEENILPACLASVAWSDDVVVLDSFSADRTVEIAKAAGARVYQRTYDNEHTQHTYGLKEIPFKYPWVYIPDADEITPPDLRDEMLAAVADPDRPEAGFRVRFKVIFMGQWLKHSSLYPTWSCASSGRKRRISSVRSTRSASSTGRWGGFRRISPITASTRGSMPGTRSTIATHGMKRASP